MFTGIVKTTGIITSRKKIPEGFQFTVKSNIKSNSLKISGSIAVNGACHTITKKSDKEFGFISMHETLKKTNLGKLAKGNFVNLERPLKVGSEIGGHFMMGHVDCTGVITKIKQLKDKKLSGTKSDNWEYWIQIEKKFRSNVISVGSISVDGVSLTVADISDTKSKFFEIKVAIIPYTYNHTIFNTYKRGSIVNLEFDFLGKYALNLMKDKLRNK